MTGTWSTGDLARAGGVTVRMLHHYDEIGLLAPSGRTASGHRRYTADDVRRLYRIRALRQLGLPLDRIAASLGSGDLRTALADQLADLDARAEHLAELRRRVRALLDTPDPAPDQLLAALEHQSLLDSYLSGRQQADLVARSAELGPEQVDALRTELLGLVAELERHQRADTPTTDPDVRRLVDRWQEIGESFHSNADAVKDRIGDLWRDHGDRLGADLARRTGRDLPAVLAYLDRARGAR
ncbi:MerR family transcriptional regulator [Saccharothrix syringae]|uniref:MerR family transcriptional regulator n=1 Tax=Saccharothrix syringae TaxID=103733 RepID=A0A5Q0H2G2_SACSY|nr:MerR family transcriptional regulator [Saccharothrix syringae]QFZ20010.1 MerR family transcriptional regulator [Saccharothrix syringae]